MIQFVQTSSSGSGDLLIEIAAFWDVALAGAGLSASPKKPVSGAWDRSGGMRSYHDEKLPYLPVTCV